MWLLDSIIRCASAASRSGKVRWRITRTAPDSRSGHTCSCTAFAIAPFSATERARKVEPDDRESPLQDGDGVDPRDRPAQLANQHEPAVHRKRLDVALQILAADDVEHDVDAASAGRLLHSRHEIGLPIVERTLRAEGLARGALLGAPGGREDTRAKHASQLNGGRADAAGTAVHEDRLARREPAALEHVRPHGEKRLGDRRGVDQVDSTRHGQALRSRGGAILGVAAARHQGADAIADAPVVAPRRRPLRCCPRPRARECPAPPAVADTFPAAASGRADSRRPPPL